MENKEKLAHLRHTLAHLLGAAVLDLYPNSKLALGPAIDDGFYYDIDVAGKIMEEDLEKIEKRMHEILPSWEIFSKIEVSEEEAGKIFSDNEYKLELIKEISKNGEQITVYYSGPKNSVPDLDSLQATSYKLQAGFIDLCRGGHAENPAKEIRDGSWKLDRIAGAYWRGNEKNKMLTRIYGLAFETKKDLEEYEKMRSEAELRDHRKLGAELEIFAFDDDVGAGLPLWLPNGAIMAEELEKLAKETEFAANYLRVRTPHIAKESMYKKSGHLPYYEESMYPPMEYEGGKYYLKAMNCPHHHKIFDVRPRSYRDLPLRLAEYGTVYRHEKSGELFGLMRVRSLQMNDAHIYCTSEQFAEEFRAVNDMYLKYFKIFGIDKYIMRFSTHASEGLGKKYVDDPELWEKTEDMVRKVLIDSAIPYVEVANEAAFYGPKIDVQVWSAIGREFTLATNQVDFAQPKRFDLTYTAKDGGKQTPLCIHRAPLGTHERFIGFLIEHYGGNFPTWLSPIQVAIVPVGESHIANSNQLENSLRENFVRTNVFDGKESLGKRIHAAKAARAPYVIVLGDKEAESGNLTVEKRDGTKIELGKEEFVSQLLKEIRERN